MEHILTPQNEAAAHLAQQAIYFMGISFILGSLTTIFILLILEMVRARVNEARQQNEMQPEE